MPKVVVIIQARLTSTRFPNKVMQTVGGIPIVKRIWMEALKSTANDVVVAWPERYPDLDENNVLERFKRVAKETGANVIVRITSDCPLITAEIINEAIDKFLEVHPNSPTWLYCNRLKYGDGYDVQVFLTKLLDDPGSTDREHVIKPFIYPTESSLPHLSVNTKADLARVREVFNAR